MSAQATGINRADPQALDALDDYKAARSRGEWARLVLAGADLRGTDMSELELDECDLAGATLDGARFVGANLVRARLVGASLLGADFSFANLDRADLQGADATAASFAGATLRRANLDGCRLHRADLADADLSKANLYDADLKAASLIGALASQTNLCGAILEDAVLTSLRGEPFFGDLSDSPPTGVSAGWPAVRLGEPQLIELAELFLSTRGWRVVELSSGDDGVDFMIAHDDSVVFVQAKSTATPSSQSFAHWLRLLKRSTEGHPNAQLILVMPGPVSNNIKELAQANQVRVLGVWVDENAMRVEEVTAA